MTLLIADHEVRVVRGKKNVDVPAGKPFDFNEGEQRDILKARPNSLRTPDEESNIKSAAIAKRDAAVEKNIQTLTDKAAEAEKRAELVTKENEELRAALATAQSNSKPQAGDASKPAADKTAQAKGGAKDDL